MPKGKCYSRKYRREWERDHPWVREAGDGTGNAFCKACHKSFLPKKNILDTHAKSVEHKNHIQAISGTKTIAAWTAPKTDQVSSETKKSEILLAAAMACHCSCLLYTSPSPRDRG